MPHPSCQDIPKFFPVLIQGRDRRLFDDRIEWPRVVPWEVLEPHEAQALKNHGQSLAVLARRGGLSPQEMVAVLRGVKWKEVAGLGTAEAMHEIGIAIRDTVLDEGVFEYLEPGWDWVGGHFRSKHGDWSLSAKDANKVVKEHRERMKFKSGGSRG